MWKMQFSNCRQNQNWTITQIIVMVSCFSTCSLPLNQDMLSTIAFFSLLSARTTEIRDYISPKQPNISGIFSNFVGRGVSGV